MHILDELHWRGLLHQTTSEAELREHCSTPGRVAYAGFDPSSDSLTVGHLVPITLLRHWQRCGHRPIVLVGGGTGLIGDPSGKDSERQLLTSERVEANLAGQKRIFDRFLDFDASAPNQAVITNNADWLCKLGFVEVLRGIGKHFSVNEMIQRDSVKRRLEEREHGISYTEFSYMLLQAYDFLHLRRELDCTVQMAGSDQYGNIVSGIDLIRREFGHDEGNSYGITAPLIMTAAGKKMGKTEKGAVWLTADRTSPYAFYQYWINTADEDVMRLVRLFTFLEHDVIEDIGVQHEQEPHARHAHRALAREMTRLVHGESKLESVETASKALFSGDVAQLSPAMLSEVFSDVPHSSHDKTALEGNGIALLDLLTDTTLAKSKREAREFLGNGAVAVNGQKVDAGATLKTADLLHGTTILLRRGKKSWHATSWV